MLKKILAVLVLPFFLVACKEEKKDAKILTIGTSADNPPFEFFREGEIVGYDIELVRLVAEKMGYQVEIKDMAFDGLLASLQAKKVDMVLAALSSTPERKKTVDFSLNYFYADWAVVARGDVDFATLESFKDKIIGVQMATSFEPYIKAEIAPKYGAEVKSLARLPDIVQELKTQRIHFMITSKSVAAAITKSQEGLKMYVISKLLPDNRVESFGIALPKGSPLTPKVNEALEDLRKEGKLEELERRWVTDIDPSSDNDPNT